MNRYKFSIGTAFYSIEEALAINGLHEARVILEVGKLRKFEFELVLDEPAIKYFKHIINIRRFDPDDKIWKQVDGVWIEESRD
jgi:hypothetical protein